MPPFFEKLRICSIKKGHKLILNIKRDFSHSFGMTNDAVISTEGRNLVVGYINFKSQKLSLLRFARNDMSLIRKIRYQLAWDTTPNPRDQEV